MSLKKHDAQWEKPDAAECKMCDFICVKCAEKAEWERRESRSWFPGLGGGSGDPLRIRLGEVSEVMEGPKTRLW